MVANVKADLRTRIGGYDKRGEIESSVPCVVVEDDTYVDELERELEDTMKGQQLPVRGACMDHEIKIPDSQVDNRLEETDVGKSQLWYAGQENGSTTEDETSQGGQGQDEEEGGCMV